MNGLCVEQSRGGWECACHDGFSGALCERENREMRMSGTFASIWLPLLLLTIVFSLTVALLHAFRRKKGIQPIMAWHSVPTEMDEGVVEAIPLHKNSSYDREETPLAIEVQDEDTF